MYFMLVCIRIKYHYCFLSKNSIQLESFLLENYIIIAKCVELLICGIYCIHTHTREYTLFLNQNKVIFTTLKMNSNIAKMDRLISCNRKIQRAYYNNQAFRNVVSNDSR